MVVSSDDFLLTAKDNWKPDLSLPLVTCTLVSASVTALGTGTGTSGPIMIVRWIPLSIRYSRDSFRQGDMQCAPCSFGQLFGTHGCIGIGDAPEGLGITYVFGRNIVQTLTLADDVQLQQGKAVRGWQKTAAQINGHPAIHHF